MADAEKYDLIIIGAGAAGLSAAIRAAEETDSILVLEYEKTPGGVLDQCIHPGFFGEELQKTGPEYSSYLYEKAKEKGVRFRFGAFVTGIEGDTAAFLTAAGEERAAARAFILASGCREKHFGELGILGSRSAGIYTGGEAQKLLNLRGLDIGDDFVIVGGGDIGMIIARRLRLLGKNVVCIVEAAQECGAMPKNQMLCQRELGIPLITGSIAASVHGSPRISSVTLKNLQTGEKREERCGALIIAAGLVPDDELDTGEKNIFVCGNAKHICPSVEKVRRDAEQAAAAAVSYIKTGVRPERSDNYTAPQRVKLRDGEKACPLCHNGCVMKSENGAVTGAKCPRGEEFFRRDQGKRYYSLALPVEGAEGALPVRTDRPATFAAVAALFQELKNKPVKGPVRAGDVIYSGDDFALVACKSF
ncbi:MAG: FAD-dependent oxidoreductase [Oscillospiraceae bacterium]|nr:FAD-dependent oxidoreductase [Oscillospiraceae bacterium]